MSHASVHGMEVSCDVRSEQRFRLMVEQIGRATIVNFYSHRHPPLRLRKPEYLTPRCKPPFPHPSTRLAHRILTRPEPRHEMLRSSKTKSPTGGLGNRERARYTELGHPRKRWNTTQEHRSAGLATSKSEEQCSEYHRIYG